MIKTICKEKLDTSIYDKTKIRFFTCDLTLLKENEIVKDSVATEKMVYDQIISQSYNILHPKLNKYGVITADAFLEYMREMFLLNIDNDFPLQIIFYIELSDQLSINNNEIIINHVESLFDFLKSEWNNLTYIDQYLFPSVPFETVYVLNDNYKLNINTNELENNHFVTKPMYKYFTPDFSISSDLLFYIYVDDFGDIERIIKESLIVKKLNNEYQKVYNSNENNLLKLYEQSGHFVVKIVIVYDTYEHNNMNSIENDTLQYLRKYIDQKISVSFVWADEN